MNDYKLATLIIFSLLLGYAMGAPTGFLVNDYMGQEYMGANVRTDSTGFNVLSGDGIAIGSSTPLYDLTIYPETATPTMMIATSSSTPYGSCDIRAKADGTIIYLTVDETGWTASTTNICN